MLYRAISFAGFLGFAGIAWIFSSHRKFVPWQKVIAGLVFQLLLGFFIFNFPATHGFFLVLNDAVLELLNVSRRGSEFLFGPLSRGPGEPGSVGFVLATQVMPVVIFFSAFTAVLYHIGFLQRVVRVFAKIFHRVLGLSGAEALYGSANVFVGVESALLVRPYIERMTRSELLFLLTSGMSTVASSTLGIYVGFLAGQFPGIAGHLLAASVLSIPAACVIAKIMIPETDLPETRAQVPPEDGQRNGNLMGAVIEGAMDGLKLAVSIGALLIAMIGMVAMIDKIIAWPWGWLKLSHPLTLEGLLGWFFYPVTFLLGLAPQDAAHAARLLGERVIFTEVVAYRDLAELVRTGAFKDPRSVMILSYALCGFAHIPSVAIFVGGTAALAPSRKDELGGLGMRALLAATLATLMTACVAGIFGSGRSLLLS
ncbi:MAG: nucleoside transporter [Candidatus Omnitrophica bacterium]|nr:nucleoside transporter [Candidatus Omnitrophota bacterium]